MSATAECTPARRAELLLRDSGYKGGGEVRVARAAKRIVRKDLKEHENAEHGGKHEHLKLKAGGAVHGKESEERPDRRARGGHVGKKAPSVKVNVGSPAEALQAEQMGRQQGMALGAKLGGAGGPPMPPRPAMPPPGLPGAGGPPGMPPQAMRPPGVMKRGGTVKQAEGGSMQGMDPRDKEICAEGLKDADMDAGTERTVAKARLATEDMATALQGMRQHRRGGAVPDDEHHKGTEYEPPTTPFDMKDGKNTDKIPDDIEKPDGKDEYVEPKDEVAGRKRGGRR